MLLLTEASNDLIRPAVSSGQSLLPAPDVPAGLLILDPESSVSGKASEWQVHYDDDLVDGLSLDSRPRGYN
jgi:hypothetical protein